MELCQEVFQDAVRVDRLIAGYQTLAGSKEGGTEVRVGKTRQWHFGLRNDDDLIVLG